MADEDTKKVKLDSMDLDDLSDLDLDLDDLDLESLDYTDTSSPASPPPQKVVRKEVKANPAPTPEELGQKINKLVVKKPTRPGPAVKRPTVKTGGPPKMPDLGMEELDLGDMPDLGDPEPDRNEAEGPDLNDSDLLGLSDDLQIETDTLMDTSSLVMKDDAPSKATGPKQGMKAKAPKKLVKQSVMDEAMDELSELVTETKENPFMPEPEEEPFGMPDFSAPELEDPGLPDIGGASEPESPPVKAPSPKPGPSPRSTPAPEPTVPAPAIAAPVAASQARPEPSRASDGDVLQQVLSRLDSMDNRLNNLETTVDGMQDNLTDMRSTMDTQNNKVKGLSRLGRHLNDKVRSISDTRSGRDGGRGTDRYRGYGDERRSEMYEGRYEDDYERRYEERYEMEERAAAHPPVDPRMKPDTYDDGTPIKRPEPILKGTAHDYFTNVLMIRWIEFLLEKVQRTRLPVLLDFYRDVGWISEDVKNFILSYARGAASEVTEIDEVTDGWKMTAEDHLKSLLFIEKISGKKINKDLLNSLEMEINTFKTSLEGFHQV